ncbi:MAG: aldo/keto reductase [Bacteroidales bacterium]|nr:aldo/keto reductase [Bacteroidales bacterium]
MGQAKKIDRRNFLRTGVAGAATFMAASSGAYSMLPASSEKSDIIYRTLGKTGIRVPVVSLGVMRADNPNLVRASIDNGITHFDTANGYQGGQNEKMLGEVFRDYPRDSFTLATKVKPAGEERRTGLPTEQTTVEDFMQKFEESMERLQMDYVDILYLHAVSSVEMANHKEITDAMKKLKKEGRVRHIGISTHTNEPEVIDAMVAAGFWDVVLTRYNFNLDYLDKLEPAIKRAAESGIGVVAMKTMAGAFFDKEKTKPVNTTAALKWSLQNKDICTTIPGMTSFDMLEENLAVMVDINMSDKERQDIMIAGTEPGLFCTTCNNCLDKCKKSLPVPDLMRAYMYAYGYTNLEKAYSLLADLETGSDPCLDCNDCSIDNCTKGFDIPAKIADISRLADVPRDFIS